MAVEIGPSKSAFKKVEALARRAAHEDGWMTPCPEYRVHKDLGEMSQSHRDGWQQTCHFDVFYGRELTRITDTEEEKIAGGIGELSWEERYYCLYSELLDRFWDTWEEATGFYDLSLKAQQSEGLV